MSENKTIHFEEKEYRAYEAISERTGFKNVDSLINTAIAFFFIEQSELKMQPEKAKQFAKYVLNEISKNPDLDIKELFRTFSLQH